MLKTNIGLTELDLEHTGIECWGWNKIAEGLEVHFTNHKGPAKINADAVVEAENAEQVGRNMLAVSSSTMEAAEMAVEFENRVYETNPMDKDQKTGCSIVRIDARGGDTDTNVTTLTTPACSFPFVDSKGTKHTSCASPEESPAEGVKPNGYWCAIETHQETSKILQWGQCYAPQSTKVNYFSDQRVFKTPKCIFPFKEVAPACVSSFKADAPACVTPCQDSDKPTASDSSKQLGLRAPDTGFWCATKIDASKVNAPTEWGQCSSNESTHIEMQTHTGCTSERKPSYGESQLGGDSPDTGFWCATKVDKSTGVAEEWGHCSAADSTHIEMDSELQTHNSCSSERKPATSGNPPPGAELWCATKVNDGTKLVEEWGHCSSSTSTHSAPDLKGVQMTIQSVDYSASQPLAVQFFDPANDTITFDTAITNVENDAEATLRRPCDQNSARIASRQAVEAAATRLRVDQKAYQNIVEDLRVAVAAKVAFPPLAMVNLRKLNCVCPPACTWRALVVGGESGVTRQP